MITLLFTGSYHYSTMKHRILTIDNDEISTIRSRDPITSSYYVLPKTTSFLYRHIQRVMLYDLRMQAIVEQFPRIHYLYKSCENILRRTSVNLISPTKYTYNYLSFALYEPFENILFLITTNRRQRRLASYLTSTKEKCVVVCIMIEEFDIRHSTTSSSTTVIDERRT